MLKRTPLFGAHQRLGAKLVEFGGWEMPVQYTSIIDEHQAVRKAAGLFDISHMGEVEVAGAGALEFLNGVLTNDASRLAVGQGQYTLMCNSRGGAIDDLYLYRLEAQRYLMIVNASRIEPDLAWLQERLRAFSGTDLSVQDRSADFGAIAVQGPRTVEFMEQLFPGPSEKGRIVPSVTALQKNQIGMWKTASLESWIARTGYTGEDGFELIAPADRVEGIWEQLLERGRPFGLKPCGLGARDTLRTEVCYPLYGHELDEQTTPIEAGLGFFVALDKGDFVGRSTLAAQKAVGVGKRCAAFVMAGKAPPPRPHYSIVEAGPGGKRIGEVVSGTLSPSLGIGIGLGYVPPAFAKGGTSIQIEIRGGLFPANVVQKPIYRKPV